MVKTLPMVVTVPRNARKMSGLAASPAIAAAALALSIASLAGARLRLDGYGLLHSLPWPYYLGLAGLPLASAVEWRRRSPRPMWVLAYVFAFLVLVWLTPYVLEHTPRFRTGYLSYGYVDPVVRGQGLLPRLFVYHNWPLFPLAMAGLQSVTAISPVTLMAFFPTVIMVLYLVPLSALLLLANGTQRLRPGPERSWRTFLKAPLGTDARWAAGLWLFVVFQWTDQDYFSPQALAFLFYLALLVVLTHAALRRRGRFDVLSGGATVMLFALIVATHVLTALVALFVIAGLTLTRQLRRPTLLLLCLFVFVAWQAYAAAPFYQFYGHRLLQTVFAAGDFLQTNVSGRISGSGAHLTVSRMRVGTTAIVFALGLAAVLSQSGLRRRRWSPVARWRSLSQELRFALALLIATVLVGPVSVYGGEMLIRTELFSLPPLAMIIAATADRRRLFAAVAGTLTIMAPVHILTHYGNELYDYVSPGEIAGFRFIADHLAPAKIYGGFPGGGFLKSRSLRWRNSTVPSAKQVPMAVDFLDPNGHHWGTARGGVYVAFSRGDVAAATLFYNKPHLISDMQRLVASDPQMRPVYITPDYSIYHWLPPASRRARTTANPSSASVPASATTGRAVAMSAGFADLWSGVSGPPNWSFGDGSGAAGAQVSHAYSAPGTYTVTVTAADGLGKPTSATYSITVSAVPPPPPAAVPPQLTAVSQSASRWREPGKNRHRKRLPIGTTFRFTLNESATVLAFTQTITGRRVSGRCVRQTRHNGHKRSCRLKVTVATTTVAGHAGRNKVAFTGKISRHRTLAPGSYTLVLTATNSARQQSARKTLRFTIVHG